MEQTAHWQVNNGQATEEGAQRKLDGKTFADRVDRVLQNSDKESKTEPNNEEFNDLMKVAQKIELIENLRK